MTDVLLVGGGGREHALAWKLAQSPRLGRMIAAPGNPGIAAHARCVPVKDTALDQLVDLARKERPDLVVVGPEVPLAMGLADRLRAAGIRAHLDDRHETLNYRIREGEVWKVPYMAIVGQREAESDSLALRVRGAGKKQEVLAAEAFLARVTEEIRTRALVP